MGTFLHTTTEMEFAQKQMRSAALRLLKAQRQLYSEAKIWWRWNFTLCVVVTSLIAVMRVLFPFWDLSLVLGSWSAFAWAISTLWIVPHYKAKRAEAALIQEEFDCEVLEIPANPTSMRIADEKVLELARKHDGLRKDQSSLENWYAPELGGLEPELRAAACQKINSSWDERLRSKYTFFLAVSLFAFVALVLISGLAFDITVRGLFANILIPIFAGVRFFADQICENLRTSKRLQRLLRLSDRRFMELASGKTSEYSARNIQDEILKHRESAGLVPDWFYFRFRTNQEQSMNDCAELLVERYGKR